MAGWVTLAIITMACGCASEAGSNNQGSRTADDTPPAAAHQRVLPEEEAQSLRVRPLETKDTVRSFEVLDGFEMQLVAHEPDVLEPIVIAYDENGLLYVAEYLKFPTIAGKSDGPDGRIRLLRDRDGNGRYEQSRVFADGLAWPSGICPWKGGVFVISVPDLWYFKDTNGDDVADVRKKVYTGFGFRNEEGTANNLIWGLDHWIYGAGSNSGGEIRPANQPNARAVSIQGRDFRFDPVGGAFEAISGSEQFGNTFDDWGNRFICQNSKPAVHVVLPARYLARNPYLPVPDVKQNIWTGGDRVYRASPVEPWRIQRTKIRRAMPREWAPSYVSHDVFTACAGVTIYRGAAYPEKYRGNLFVGDVQSNLVHRRVLRPNGVSFESLRADEQTEMVRSKDICLRPANLLNAPDGTLHVVDMYREVIETPDSLPDEILAKVDLLSGHERGRIYRLAPPGFKVPPPPQLGSATTSQLVSELENPNGWWRDTAGRLIYERQDRAAVEPLRALLDSSESELTRLHVLYALAGLDGLADEVLLTLLADRSAGVREHAVRLSESRLRRDGKISDAVVALASDPTPRVRFQVAFSLGETRDPRAAEGLAEIAKRDAADRWIQTAVLSSALNLADGMIARLLNDEPFSTSDGGQQLLRQLALVVGGRGQDDEVRRVLKLVETHPAAFNPGVRRVIILGLGEGLRRSRLSLRGFVHDSSSSAALLDGLIRQAKENAATGAATSLRLQAIEMLVHGSFDDVSETLARLLDSREPPVVQLAAVQGFSSFPHTEAATALIDAWPGLSPAVRGEVVEALLGRRAWIDPLLVAVAQQRIPAGHIDPTRKSLLLKHRDATIRERAVKLLTGDELSPRKKVVADYRSALELEGDPARGLKVFDRDCVTCHKVAGRGHDVGPNLATIQNRTSEELTAHILDPNRDLQPNYVNYVVVLADGRVVSGLIASESPTSITLQRAENVRQTILRQNIEEIIGTSKSLMPEGLEQKIDKQEMSDLIAYLLALKKP